MTKSKTTKRKKTKGIPAWVSDLFKQFLDDVDRLTRLMDLSVRGISMIRAMPKAVNVLSKVSSDSPEEKKSQLENAKQMAEFAQEEVDAGFPVLYAWAIVGIWSHLEALIRVLIEAWLRHKRSSWKIKQIQKLRIKLGDYESIPRGHKYAYITELLERELGSGLISGVTRFEVLLEPFGLSGEVPDKLGRTIYEFGQVRNIIVHRTAKADRKFIQACPWLKATVGDDLQITASMFNRYHFATVTYITLLICRIGEKYEVDMSEDIADLEKSIESHFSDDMA